MFSLKKMNGKFAWTVSVITLLNGLTPILTPSAIAGPESVSAIACQNGREVCITGVKMNKNATVLNVFLHNDFESGFSHLNFRWSRPGKAVVQVELKQDKEVFSIKNPRGNTRYDFAVQGCRSGGFLQSSTCTNWHKVYYKTAAG
jgi:uncharacterized protein YkuJ